MANTSRKLPVSRIARSIVFLVLAGCCAVVIIASLYVSSFLVNSELAVLMIACCAFAAAFGFEMYWLVGGRSTGEATFSLGNTFRVLAFVFFWSVVIGLVLAAFVGLISLGFSGGVPLLAYLLAFLSVLLLAVSWATRFVRRRRTLLILSHLEKAVRLEIGLPRMILAAADSETGALRQKLLSLHDYLDRGEPVDQALAHACPEIPQPFLRAIAVGEQMGCLAHVLSGLVRGREGRDDSPMQQGAGIYWAYPVFIVAIVGLMMIAVIPKYQGIFRDFNTPLPGTTRLLITISTAFSTAIPLLGLILLTLAPLGWAVATLFPSFRPISPFGEEITDHILWWMPVSRGYIRDRGMAELCDLLSVGVESGRPFDESLREAAGAQANSVMRHRAIMWAQAVAQGQPIHESARNAKMPALFVAMLATARDTAGMGQVLEFLWRHYEYRFNRIRTILRASYMPIVVFTLGSVVAFIAAALLSPMAALIRGLSGVSTGGF
jgi:type IV pilus assembly protein PilC